MSSFSSSSSSSYDLAIRSLSFIGKQNEPLYFYYSNDSEETKAQDQGTIFSSLDMLEENLSRQRQALYLGHITNGEDSKVYGYCSNTMIKIIVLASPDLPSTSSEAMRELCTNLYTKYVEVMKNPFQDINGVINSNKFNETIHKLVVRFNEQNNHK